MSKKLHVIFRVLNFPIYSTYHYNKIPAGLFALLLNSSFQICLPIKYKALFETLKPLKIMNE